MRLILILAFFLGLISIVVPLKFLGITTRRRGVIVMILSFGILVLYSAAFMPNMVTPVSVSNPNSLLLATKPNLTSATAGSVPTALPSSSWRYSEQEDKMRNQSTRYASLDSDNQLNFGFPYNGGSIGRLSLRISPKYGKDVILEINKGQFVCSFEGCVLHVKFDQGPIQSYSAAEAADGSSNVLFIRNYSGFVSQLRRSKTLRIEAQFYQEGSQQLEFSTAGLNW